MNALYYVTFTTAVLVASFILFQGFNTVDPVNTISLICGFIIIFLGVFLLDLSRTDPNAYRLTRGDGDALPTDGLSALQTRYSMQSQRSVEHHRRSLSNGSIAFSPRVPRGDREALMHSYDAENQQFALADLAEDSEGEMGSQSNGKPDGAINGTHKSGPGR